MPVPTAPNAESRVLLRDRIRDQIRAAILDGTLQPGERLIDDELVAWLGCSRTPIREALSDLEHAGLIEIEPNRFTRVAMPRDDEAFEVIQTLGVLMGGAVRLATPRLTPAVRLAVTDQVDVCLNDLAAGETLTLNVHVQEMFALFVENCGNEHLKKVCHEATSGLAYKLRLSNVDEIFDLASVADSFHDLREATISNDPVAAELAAERMHQLHITDRALQAA